MLAQMLNVLLDFGCFFVMDTANIAHCTLKDVAHVHRYVHTDWVK